MAIPHRRDRRELTVAKLAEPEFLDELCEKIAEGGTLLDVCKEYGLVYRLVYRWIESGESRKEEYELAVAARNANLNDRVVSGIVQITGTTAKDFFDDDGNPLSVTELPDAAAAAVQTVETTTDKDGVTTKRLKTYDKLRALELAGRNQKMFTDKVDLGGVVKLEDLVQASMSKPDAKA